MYISLYIILILFKINQLIRIAVWIAQQPRYILDTMMTIVHKHAFRRPGIASDTVRSAHAPLRPAPLLDPAGYAAKSRAPG